MPTATRPRFGRSWRRSDGLLAIMLLAGGLLIFCFSADPLPPGLPAAAAASSPTTYTVLGYNDLGMHCMNQDFSEICILPPFNTLRAQVIRRGSEPSIVKSGVTVEYSIPGNTVSSNKTNFWTYAPKLFGANVPPDVGLTGNRLSGKMAPSGVGDWIVSGIPITPVTDKKAENPFQLSSIVVKDSKKKTVASTVAVVPVSWEINCQLCHNTPESASRPTFFRSMTSCMARNLLTKSPSCAPPATPTRH